MGASIIDGKALAAAAKAEAAEKVTALKAQGVNPCLAVILVGENPASQVYVRGKINDCAQCGIESRSINLPADTTQETLLAEVKKLADDPAVHGILVQLPLPEQIDEKAVIDAIPFDRAAPVSELLEKTGLAVADLLPILLALQMKKAAEELPGGYIRCAAAFSAL